MYHIEKIKADLITEIKSQIKEPIINCPLYDSESDTWKDSTDPMEQSIEAVVEFEWFVSVHITTLNPDSVFGVSETEDEHDTQEFSYEELDLEALYKIANYLEKRNS